MITSTVQFAERNRSAGSRQFSCGQGVASTISESSLLLGPFDVVERYSFRVSLLSPESFPSQW
jgi:hypothetical protein